MEWNGSDWIGISFCEGMKMLIGCLFHTPGQAQLAQVMHQMQCMQTWAQLLRCFQIPFHSLTMPACQPASLPASCEGPRPDFRRSRARRASPRASHRWPPQFKERNLRENLITVPVPPCKSESERLKCGCSGDYISKPWASRRSFFSLRESFLFFLWCSPRPPRPPFSIRPCVDNCSVIISSTIAGGLCFNIRGATQERDFLATNI
jgi:hypothetical protein